MADLLVRWCLCRVTEEIDTDGAKHRWPKVGDLEDPGAPIEDILDPVTELPTGQQRHHSYSYTAAISDGLPGQDNDWCLVQVVGFDFTTLDSDPDVINLLEIEYLQSERMVTLRATVSDLLSEQALGRVKARMLDRGVDAKGIVSGNTIQEVLDRAGRKWNPNFNASREIV